MLVMDPDMAVTAIAIRSFGVTVVVVKSLKAEDCTAVPPDNERPFTEIEFADVGMAVPPAAFQNLTVMAPLSPDPTLSV